MILLILILNNILIYKLKKSVWEVPLPICGIRQKFLKVFNLYRTVYSTDHLGKLYMLLMAYIVFKKMFVQKTLRVSG